VEYLHRSLRVVEGDEKERVESETVKYCRESHETRTREWLRWRAPAAILGRRESTRSPVKNGANFIDSRWLWAVMVVTKYDCNKSANKSNHPIQNPLLLVTERWTLDSIKMNLREIRSRCIWPWIRTRGGLLWTWIWTFAFCIMLGNFWVAEWLQASQEGLRHYCYCIVGRHDLLLCIGLFLSIGATLQTLTAPPPQQEALVNKRKVGVFMKIIFHAEACRDPRSWWFCCTLFILITCAPSLPAFRIPVRCYPFCSGVCHVMAYSDTSPSTIRSSPTGNLY
jgi:hypothetical protein